MPKEGKHDRHYIEIGIFEGLGEKGFICPKGIEIAIILDRWVVEHERDIAVDAIEDGIEGDAPLHHPRDDEDRICVTSVAAAEKHVMKVEKDIYDRDLY